MSASHESPSPSGEGLGWGSPEAHEQRLLRRANAMRCEPTEPEKRLWRHLSNSQLGGLKFRRQAVIQNRIVDFFCPSVGLIVEVDGHTHVPETDAARDHEAKLQGFATLRFSNTEVIENSEGVLAAIFAAAKALPARSAWRLPHPNPSPEGEGL